MKSTLDELFPSEKSKIVAGVAVGVGLATAATAGYLYKKKLDNSPPKKWRKVGELADLVCYPIKSCGPVRYTELQTTVLGLKDGEMRDRVFMITNPEGRFLTARIHPKFLHISPKIEGENMIMSAPEMPDFTLNIGKLYAMKPKRTIIWKDTVDSVDCGEEVAKWISTFVLGKDSGLKLFFYPKHYSTKVNVNKKGFLPDFGRNDTGSLQDETSIMLMNQASIDDLNTRLDEKVYSPRFRPNFLVKGPKAFEEDNWKWVRIGNKAIFNYVKPCGRCIFTTIDPDSAIRNSAGQPLKTLKSYRKFEGEGEAPLFGVHFGIRVEGTVKLGDPVYVGME